MSITTLSRQGAGVYRLSGLGVGLVSALLCVGGIAPPTPPTPPTPTPPLIDVPVVPSVPPRQTTPSVGASGGGGGVSWTFEGTPFERRARAALTAPVGRMTARGIVTEAVSDAPVSVQRIARVSGVAGLPQMVANGYIFNLARHNADARRVLDEDDDEETRLEDV